MILVRISFISYSLNIGEGEEVARFVCGDAEINDGARHSVPKELR